MAEIKRYGKSLIHAFIHLRELMFIRSSEKNIFKSIIVHMRNKFKISMPLLNMLQYTAIRIYDFTLFLSITTET